MVVNLLSTYEKVPFYRGFSENGRFARFEISVKIVKNVTEMANRGKTGHIDSVNRSKNVVGIGDFYYSTEIQINMYFTI